MAPFTRLFANMLGNGPLVRHLHPQPACRSAAIPATGGASDGPTAGSRLPQRCPPAGLVARVAARRWPSCGLAAGACVPLASRRRRRDGDRALHRAPSGCTRARDVRILGVRVGRSRSVTPEGDDVRVELDVDATVACRPTPRRPWSPPRWSATATSSCSRPGPAGPAGRRRRHRRWTAPPSRSSSTAIYAEPGRPARRARPEGRQQGRVAVSRLLATGAANLDGQGEDAATEAMHRTSRGRSATLSGRPRRPVRHGEEPADVHHHAGHERPAGAPAQHRPRERRRPARPASGTTSRRP